MHRYDDGDHGSFISDARGIASLLMADLISLEEALARIFEQVRPLNAEPVPLAAAAGRVIAGDAGSLVDLPPFASSAMDGFAVRRRAV